MPRKPSITESQIDLICELRESTDLSLAQIGRKVGASMNQVRWWCRERGAIGARDVAEFARRKPASRPMLRNGRLVVPFTDLERERLAAAAGGSQNYHSLGRELGRNPGSIRAWYFSQARRDALLEEMAQ